MSAQHKSALYDDSSDDDGGQSQRVPLGKRPRRTNVDEDDDDDEEEHVENVQLRQPSKKKKQQFTGLILSLSGSDDEEDYDQILKELEEKDRKHRLEQLSQPGDSEETLKKKRRERARIKARDQKNIKQKRREERERKRAQEKSDAIVAEKTKKLMEEYEREDKQKAERLKKDLRNMRDRDRRRKRKQEKEQAEKAEQARQSRLENMGNNSPLDEEESQYDNNKNDAQKEYSEFFQRHGFVNINEDNNGHDADALQHQQQQQQHQHTLDAWFHNDTLQSDDDVATLDGYADDEAEAEAEAEAQDEYQDQDQDTLERLESKQQELNERLNGKRPRENHVRTKPVTRRRLRRNNSEEEDKDEYQDQDILAMLDSKQQDLNERLNGKRPRETHVRTEPVTRRRLGSNNSSQSSDDDSVTIVEVNDAQEDDDVPSIPDDDPFSDANINAYKAEQLRLQNATPNPRDYIHTYSSDHVFSGLVALFFAGFTKREPTPGATALLRTLNNNARFNTLVIENAGPMVYAMDNNNLTSLHDLLSIGLFNSADNIRQALNVLLDYSDGQVITILLKLFSENRSVLLLTLNCIENLLERAAKDYNLGLCTALVAFVNQYGVEVKGYSVDASVAYSSLLQDNSNQAKHLRQSITNSIYFNLTKNAASIINHYDQNRGDDHAHNIDKIVNKVNWDDTRHNRGSREGPLYKIVAKHRVKPDTVRHVLKHPKVSKALSDDVQRLTFDMGPPDTASHLHSLHKALDSINSDNAQVARDTVHQTFNNVIDQNILQYKFNQNAFFDSAVDVDDEDLLQLLFDKSEEQRGITPLDWTELSRLFLYACSNDSLKTVKYLVDRFSLSTFPLFYDGFVRAIKHNTGNVVAYFLENYDFTWKQTDLLDIAAVWNSNENSSLLVLLMFMGSNYNTVVEEMKTALYPSDHIERVESTMQVAGEIMYDRRKNVLKFFTDQLTVLNGDVEAALQRVKRDRSTEIRSGLMNVLLGCNEQKREEQSLDYVRHIGQIVFNNSDLDVAEYLYIIDEKSYAGSLEELKNAQSPSVNLNSTQQLDLSQASSSLGLSHLSDSEF